MTARLRGVRGGADEDSSELTGGLAMAHLKPLTVLLADDYEANRSLQKAQLEALGYPTDTVANGEEVLRALNARPYDVVLLDIQMPLIDGLETVSRIRRQRLDPQPFVVAVTAIASAPERARISQAGFDAFIAKPAGQREFAAVLAQAYAKKSGHDLAGIPDAAANDDTPLLDFGMLYSRLGSAADVLLRRVIPLYLRELPRRTAELRAAFDRRDAQALAQLCHGLKGASRIVGATGLAAICERSEQQAYAGILPERQDLDELLELARRAARQLRRRLDALGS
ncbi:MAG: response regulator [Gammaproteobacteria bacterium]|nr:response regulator [Gammaproteobacteria bacterium]